MLYALKTGNKREKQPHLNSCVAWYFVILEGRQLSNEIQKTNQNKLNASFTYLRL